MRTNALEVLRKDHRHLQQLFKRLEDGGDSPQDKLCDEMVEALREHTRIEEEVFYPYLRAATDQEELLEEASVEHTSAEQLLEDLDNGSDAVHRQAVLKVLGDYVGHHIREEEDRIFPLVEKTGVDLDALGEELLEHKQGRGGAMAAKGAGRGGGHGSHEPRPASHAKHSARDDRQFVEEHSAGLSRSTQRAKWIEDAKDGEDHPGQTLATRNREVIKAWADERKARPATSPGGNTEDPRVLRFDFPDYDKNLQPVSWDAWMRTFERRDLVFLFQQHKKDGKQSNFFRLDSPDREDG